MCGIPFSWYDSASTVFNSSSWHSWKIALFEHLTSVSGVMMMSEDGDDYGAEIKRNMMITLLIRITIRSFPPRLIAI